MKINELRDQLANQITKLENGEMPLKTAKEITRTTQAIIESIRVEIIYSKHVKTKCKIDFMDY
jgi:exonuclease VII small subunit